MKRAFTLIELLIVVAIIAILAAIAVPNFLEAQTRAKVSRIRADIRTLATAIEAYHVDANAYPPHLLPGNVEVNYPERYVYLTTPIAYLSSIVADDVFYRDPPTGPGAAEKYISWTNLKSFENRPGGSPLLAAVESHRYLLRSRGPDGVNESNSVRNNYILIGLSAGPSFLYDPTNGTVSQGDLIRTALQTQ